MAKRYGTCSECPEPLTHPTAKTCCAAHRSQRARRIKRQQVARGQANALPEQQKALSEAVRGRAMKDVVHEVAKEEVRPIVREAITEDVMRGIAKLVGLTPRLIDLLEADLGSDDDTVRQRAYTLALKYTLGNDSVKPAPADAGTAPMQVIFAMPRPGDPTLVVDGSAMPTDPPDELAETRPCSECKEFKTAFEGSSDRCTDCHAAVLEKVAHLRGDAPTS